MGDKHREELLFRSGVQHLWHTARNEATAKGGKGSGDA